VRDRAIAPERSFTEPQIGARVRIKSRSAGGYVEACVVDRAASGLFQVKHRHRGSRVQLLNATQLEDGKQRQEDETRKARERKREVPVNTVASHRRTYDLDEFVETHKLQKFATELEELGVAAAAYDAHPINIGDGSQFSKEFVRANPNSKIPAMVDRNGPDGDLAPPTPIRSRRSLAGSLPLAETAQSLFGILLVVFTEFCLTDCHARRRGDHALRVWINHGLPR
jgi:hypothetical protein